jgi:hypothetical protein
MTSSLTVIGLVVRLKVSVHITHGDALYREKTTNETHAFCIKQFVNARHDYNEAYKEGDLVLFGGKFTLDDQKKLSVSIISCFYM